VQPKHSSHTLVNRLSAGPVTHLRISGVIDETFSAQTFTKDLSGHVLLDLGRVERISSFGVRKWIEFAGKMPPGVTGMYIIHAPPAIVDQLNMVEGFAGVTQVLSVLAPYTCPRCGEDKVRLVDIVQEAALLGDAKAPPHDCPVCQSPLQFADLPAEFFDYVRHQSPVQLDPAVQRYLRTLQPSEPGTSDAATNVKLVHDDITFFRVASELRGDLNARKMANGLEGRVVYDFGHVVSVEPEAGAKLLQILDTASQGAKVYLWRVPPEVLTLLARSEKPLNALLATLYLPCDCRNCGNKSYQRLEAAAYVRGLAAGDPGERICGICGGKARVPALREHADFLAQTPLAQGRLEDVEALEPRALSQYLVGSGDTGTHSKPDTGSFNSSLKLQILRRLGQGGMAEVFLARQVGLKGFEKYVVVKKILENLASQPDFVDMLFAEARANARLTHQNIVQTFDVGMMGGVAYITMEYVRGPDVKKLMALARKAQVQVPLQHLLRIVAETAAGLHYAHSYVDPTGKPHPMVHRDVSPHNILLSLDGAIKLSDFGIAKVQGESENTRPGTFKGKIAYLSPEAIAGLPVDARSDVFALGVTLFELLAGRLPFRKENEAATLHAIMRLPAPNLSEINPQVPEDLSALVTRSLEKDPARRVQSAGEFHKELETIMGRHNLNASPTAVAMFFQEALAQQLAEYAPSAGATSGSGSNSQPKATAAPSASAQQPIPLSQEVPNALDATLPPQRSTEPKMFVPKGKGTLPPPVAEPRPPAPLKRQGEPSRPVPMVQPPPPPPPTPVMTPAVQANALAAAQSSTPPPAPKKEPSRPASGAFAPPPLSLVDPAAEPPTLVGAPGQQERKKEPPPRRPASVSMPPPAAAQAPAPAPMLAVEPVTSPSSPGAAFDSEPRSGGFKLWLGVLAVAVMAGVAGVALLSNRDSGKVPISNLAADESLYVAGLKVDPRNLRLEGTQPLMVSTAKDGRLRRLGRVTPTPGSGIDVKGLIEVSEAGTAAQTAPLHVSSEPSGCPVRVDGKPLPESTPTRTDVEAGRELIVEVACPGKPPFTQAVLAAPGQAIEVLARGSAP